MYANPNWKQELMDDTSLTEEEKQDLITNYKEPKWNPSHGVSPKMVNYVCKKLNISCYAFDITKNCFLKHITKNRNYDALVYYCVNNHFYFISDKKEVLKLTATARDIETKIKLSIVEDEIKKENIYRDATIYENVSIDKLLDYDDCIIIYSKSGLNEEYDKIIELYNYIPKKKTHKFTTTQIIFKYDGKNIILVIDPNDLKKMNYKDVKVLCEKVNIEFENQSFSTLVKQLKDRFYDSKSIRHKFTTEERTNLFNKNNKCGCCQKELNKKKFHIDHIIPLACGGTNDENNLQLLCVGCHYEKTKNEQEEGYIKINETESSFNGLTKK